MNQTDAEQPVVVAQSSYLVSRCSQGLSVSEPLLQGLISNATSNSKKTVKLSTGKTLLTQLRALSVHISVMNGLAESEAPHVLSGLISLVQTLTAESESKSYRIVLFLLTEAIFTYRTGRIDQIKASFDDLMKFVGKEANKKELATPRRALTLRILSELQSLNESFTTTDAKSASSLTANTHLFLSIAASSAPVPGKAKKDANALLATAALSALRRLDASAPIDFQQTIVACIRFNALTLSRHALYIVALTARKCQTNPERLSWIACLRSIFKLGDVVATVFNDPLAVTYLLRACATLSVLTKLGDLFAEEGIGLLGDALAHITNSRYLFPPSLAGL